MTTDVENAANALLGMFDGGRVAGGGDPVAKDAPVADRRPARPAQISVRDGGFVAKSGRTFGPLTKPNEPLEVVIIADAGRYNRVLFAQDGSPEQARGFRGPLCVSVDGIVPDPGAQKPQAAACNQCPMAKFGSSGKQGSNAPACNTRLQVAVLRLADPNTILRLDLPFGGWSDLERHRDLMLANNTDMRNIVTSITATRFGGGGWSMSFGAVRMLTPEECAAVIASKNANAEAIQSAIAPPPEQPKGQQAQVPIPPPPPHLVSKGPVTNPFGGVAYDRDNANPVAGVGGLPPAAPPPVLPTVVQTDGPLPLVGAVKSEVTYDKAPGDDTIPF